jgi:maleamate amidohydrolase
LRNFLKGSPTAAFGPGLIPCADELVVSKQYPSAFFATSLASTLTAAGIDSVILTGLTTSGCVRASCVDAMSHGFRTAVVAEACGDRHPDPHEANLFDMNAKYADVVSEDEAAQFLRSLVSGAAAV